LDRNIIFDLDGTLSDPKVRLYSLFVELTPDNKFSFAAYWEIKRNKIDQACLLERYFDYSKEEIAQFRRQWLAKIEERERLKLDTPLPGAGTVLKTLSKDNQLYVVSNRQSRESAIEQIEDYGWGGYITRTLVTLQKTSKANLIQESLTISKDDIIIGDTGEDILTGKKLGITTIAVTSGMLNRRALLEYNPDQIIDSVKEIANNYDVRKIVRS
jgi:phosphoglycolate phosphatase